MPHTTCTCYTCCARLPARHKVPLMPSERLMNAASSRGFEGIEHAASNGSDRVTESVLWFTRVDSGIGWTTFGNRLTPWFGSTQELVESTHRKRDSWSSAEELKRFLFRRNRESRSVETRTCR